MIMMKILNMMILKKKLNKIDLRILIIYLKKFVFANNAF